MSWTFVGLVVALVAVFVAYLKRLHTYWAQHAIPYDEPVFPYGSLKGIGKTKHFRDINATVYKRFKGKTPVVGMYFLFKPVAMIIDLEAIKNILIKDFSNFRDRGVFSNPRDEPLTGHLFSLDAEPWRALRTKLTPVFTSGKMKFMFPTIVSVSDSLIEACDSLVSADKNGVLDFKEFCACYTTDVIGTCAFGLECNSLKDPNAEFRVMGRSIFKRPRHSRFVQSFIKSNHKLAKILGMKLLPDDIHEFFMDAVRKTVDYRIKNKINRHDFMDLLIELKAENEEAARKGEGIDLSHGLTIEQIAAQAFVFFIAGFDTSSTTMYFCLYELALHTDIQDKLREEIDSVLKKYNGEICYEAMNEMVYLDMVISETLRKYSVFAHLVRQTLNDYQIPNSQYTLKAGTLLIIPVAAIQKDPEYFPDPEKFDPSRFEPEEITKRHPMVYLPFGDGPRNCIGMRFGKMQAKVGLINLLKHFKFSKSQSTEVPIELEKGNFIIAAKNGIHLHVERV